MARAIVPAAVPELGEATSWRRSTRRPGGVFHAHVALGQVLCGGVLLDRNASAATDALGELQYWGVCPRCYGKAGNS
jgi:hypothetical protein